MDFELTQEIVDQIIFAMEDQTGSSVVVRSSGQVVTLRAGTEPDERHAPIPEWKPVDGYQLMERFLTGLRNPILREELRSALGAGRGVFRSFKDALRRSPEIERRWYRFKEREMRRVVYDWYNQMRELQGLERLSLEPPEEPEDSELLIRTDFLFAEGPGSRAALLQEADRAAFAEAHAALGPEKSAALWSRRNAKYPAVDEPASLVIMADDHAGQLAGFVWGVVRSSAYASGEQMKILQLWITPGYRGIGLASALLRRFLMSSSERGIDCVLVDLRASSLEVAELFSRQGFRPVSQLLGIDLAEWAEDGRSPVE